MWLTCALVPSSGSQTCKVVTLCQASCGMRAYLLNIMLVDFGSSSTRFKSVVVNEASNVTPALVLGVSGVGGERTG